MAPGRTPEPIDSAIVAGWHARRGVLLAKLHHEPDGTWAWLWQMHLDIVDYLIHRYADASGEAGDVEPLPRSESAAQSVDPNPDAPGTHRDSVPEPDLPRLHGSARVAKAASLEGPAAERLRDTLRGWLSSLHATNDDRRARQPPIKPTPPPIRYRYVPVTYLRKALTPHQIGVVLTRRTSYPGGLAAGSPDESETGVEPFDDTSLELFRQAIAYDRDWDLEVGEALTDDEVIRLLNGEALDTELGDVAT